MAITRSELTKGMQFSWPRTAKEPIPRIRSEPSDTGKSSIDITELYRTDQSRQVTAERAHSGITLRLRLDGNDKKDRRTRQRSEDLLWKRNLVWPFSHRHATRFPLQSNFIGTRYTRARKNLYRQTLSTLPKATKESYRNLYGRPN